MTTYVLVLALLIGGQFSMEYRGEYLTEEQCVAMAQVQKVPQTTTAARAFCLPKEPI